jgi:hypothetical protein
VNTAHPNCHLRDWNGQSVIPLPLSCGHLQRGQLLREAAPTAEATPELAPAGCLLATICSWAAALPEAALSGSASRLLPRLPTSVSPPCHQNYSFKTPVLTFFPCSVFFSCTCSSSLAVLQAYDYPPCP